MGIGHIVGRKTRGQDEGKRRGGKVRCKRQWVRFGQEKRIGSLRWGKRLAVGKGRGWERW